VRVDDRAVLDRAHDIIRDRHMDTIAERRRPGRYVRLSPEDRRALDHRYDAERWAVEQLTEMATVADALACSDPLVREAILLALGEHAS
jgi:hypothetical protein